MSRPRSPSSAVTSFVVASRYLPVYVAIVLLVVIASIWAPATLRGPGLSSIAPFGTFLAITALGQMLVIMTGGIDLSVPGTLTLAAVITVGVGQGSDERIWTAIGIALVLAAVVGLVNGILIGGLGLNALIVTLAVGQIVSGIAFRYYSERRDPDPGPRRALRVDVDALPRRHPDLLDGGGHHARVDRPVPVHDARPEVPGGRRQPDGRVGSPACGST